MPSTLSVDPPERVVAAVVLKRTKPAPANDRSRSGRE